MTRKALEHGRLTLLLAILLLLPGYAQTQELRIVYGNDNQGELLSCDYSYDIGDLQETQNLLDNLRKTNSALVDEVVPNLLSVGEVQKVLANLLHERISIRDMSTILEVLADYGIATKDTDVLTEYVRHAMARHITQQNVISICGRN